MSVLATAPSFWPDARDPWAWHRALRAVNGKRLPDPTPCWEAHLRGSLPRSAVAGLYGWKVKPHPGNLLGVGLILPEPGGWAVASAARALLEAEREELPPLLADWLLRHSFWVRLAVRRLAEGRWQLAGADPLRGRALRLDTDLLVDPADLGRCHEVRLGPWAPEVVLVRLRRQLLGALHAPLHLLWSLGMLSAEGRPTLPAAIHDELLPTTAASLLRRITREEADVAGFVPIERAAARLANGWLFIEAYGGHEWSDRVFARAFETGMIEVHEWAPGQPRHGRGFQGDRSRKLVRWTVHDDFALSRYPDEKEITG